MYSTVLQVESVMGWEWEWPFSRPWPTLPFPVGEVGADGTITVYCRALRGCDLREPQAVWSAILPAVDDIAVDLASSH